MLVCRSVHVSIPGYRGVWVLVYRGVHVSIEGCGC